MSLLTAGYWQSRYNPNSYWQEDYWQDALGAAGPPMGGHTKYWFFGPSIRLIIFIFLFIIFCMGT